MKKLLSISTLLILLGVFLAADLSYAAAPKGMTDQGKKAADEGTSKKSVLNGCDTLIQKGKFIQGANFSYEEYKELRLAYGRAATGNSKWSISDDMLHRELKSMIMMGVIAAGENGYDVQVAMDVAQMNQIDTRFGIEIEPLTRKDSQRDANIGLNSYDLVEVTTPDEQLVMRQIVGQVLLTGKTIQTADTDNALNGMGYDRVICLTENQISGPNALSSEVLSDKLQVLGGGESYKLAIATMTKIEVNEATGMLRDESQAYVKKLLEALPMGYEEARKLFERKVIVFSYIPREDIFIQIEKMTAPLSTLNNLTPEQATAVLKNV